MIIFVFFSEPDRTRGVKTNECEYTSIANKMTVAAIVPLMAYDAAAGTACSLVLGSEA